MRLSSSSSHRPLPRAAALVACLFLPLVTLPAANSPIAANEASAWLADFEFAYEQGDSAAYAALLAAEFRFHFGDAENRARRPQGWNKEEELASYVNIHRGVLRADGTRLPRAVALDIQMAGVREGPDPDHPGSLDHRLVFVQAATLVLVFEDGRRVVDTAPHAFHLVLGRASGRGGDEAATWFARKWVERPTEVRALLAAMDDARDALALANSAASPRGSEDDPAEGGVAIAAAPAALPARGILWPNPVRAGRRVRLAFDLADNGADVELEVFDVRGRALAHVGPVRESAGRRVLTWDGRDDAGCAVAAGVYFVRARLGDREARHRVVILH